ncbi:HAD-IA family hydrolase [Candidatus Latescibacterota bacterium]
MNKLRAVVFDVDGTIAETERDGHLVAFNRAFDELKIPVQWDVETYGMFLRIGGGKERIRVQLDNLGYTNREGFDDLVRSLHERKTTVFRDIVNSGGVPLRPGIKRVITDIHNAGIKLAVASTSHENAVNTVLQRLLGDEIMEWFDIILAGDVVSRKKPDPAIYTLVSERLGISPAECLVIEDSGIGCEAAVSAGMKCLITSNHYTSGENFKGADLVVDSLGDPGMDPVSVTSNPGNVPVDDYVTVGTFEAIIR